MGFSPRQRSKNAAAAVHEDMCERPLPLTAEGHETYEIP
jgi:hypothetical protein